VRSTGSASHVSALSDRARGLGLDWTDAGLKRDGQILPLPGEEEVYRTLGLPLIAPELREALGEIEAAAAGRLPKLVEEKDIKGFLHCHSNYSDGTSTAHDWAVAARAAGYAYAASPTTARLPRTRADCPPTTSPSSTRKSTR